MSIMPNITEYEVRAGTTRVDSLTFRKCRSLSNVTLPEGLLTIGDCAFSFCSSLRQLQIPASVERIGVLQVWLRDHPISGNPKGDRRRGL